MASDYDSLVKELDKRGYRFVSQKGGHLKLTYKAGGKPVRDASGKPIMAASTPSDSRAYANLISKLRASQIIDRDPRGATARSSRRELEAVSVPSVSPAFAQARDAFAARRRAELQEAGDLARVVLGPLWEQLSAAEGWSRKGWRVLMADAFAAWVEQTDRESLFAHASRMADAMHELLRGNNVEPLRAMQIIEFAEYLDGEAFAKIQALAAGLPVPKVEEPEAEPEAEFHRVPGKMLVAREKVDFAMEVLAEMLGNGDQGRITRALALARRLLEG